MALFANIFTHSEGFLFVLFMVSFAVQSFQVSLGPICLFLFFYFHFSRRWVRKDLAVIYETEFSACVFFEEFYSVWPYISVFNPFCVYFLYGVRECSNLILLHVAVQFSQHHLLKRLSFLHCICLPPLSKIS